MGVTLQPPRPGRRFCLTKEMSMRKLTGHIVNPANDKIVITVDDEPGQGGANHRYVVEGMNFGSNPGYHVQERSNDQHQEIILFQNGPIAEAGVNGLTHEVLLAILIDRLQGFQRGKYACRENAIALTKLEEVQMWLQKRTRDRMARGVEGTHTV